MQQFKHGKQLLLVLALLLASCRQSQPPAIEICLGDGVGGADCIEADGSKLYRLPSQLNNYWMTNQPDMKNFASWCYSASSSQTSDAMSQIRDKITH